MRVLVLTNMFPPHAYGGYELWCQDVVRRWTAAGHQVVVLTSDVRRPDATDVEDPSLQVSRRLRLYWADHEVLDPAPWRRLGLERHNQRVLDQELSAFRPDVVSAWAMGAMSFGLLARAADRGLPLVSVVCDEWPDYGPAMDAWSRAVVRRRLSARVLRLATGLPCRLPDLDAGPACFVSEAMRAKARASTPWSFAMSGVVPSGIDRSEFSPRSTHPTGATAGTGAPFGWRLLHVGRLDPRKGLHTVVEALAACPSQATLSLVGGGDDAYRRALETLAEDLGVAARVTFDQCPRHQLAARYRDADAAVFAPQWDEPFGLVPLEAMSCGTPVVASPTGGSAEFLVDGANCLAFGPGDVGGLVAALGRLAADAALRAQLVAGGLATSARYDSDVLATELEQWHQRAIGDSGGQADPGG